MTHSVNIALSCTVLSYLGACSFLFAFHSNYGSILHHLQDKARYWSKIVIFSYPHCIRRPRYGGLRRNIAIPFGAEKLEWWGYPMAKFF